MQVALAQSCQIGCDCVFGAGTSVGENAVITRSVLGRMCSIGKGVKIINSILMTGVSVGDGAVICDSIIGHGVVSFLLVFFLAFDNPWVERGGFGFEVVRKGCDIYFTCSRCGDFFIFH